MIYLDNGATTLHKPQAVRAAVNRALLSCANPGRGGYPAALWRRQRLFSDAGVWPAPCLTVRRSGWYSP